MDRQRAARTRALSFAKQSSPDRDGKLKRLLIALSFFFGAAAPDPPVADDLGSVG